MRQLANANLTSCIDIESMTSEPCTSTTRHGESVPIGVSEITYLQRIKIKVVVYQLMRRDYSLWWSFFSEWYKSFFTCWARNSKNYAHSPSTSSSIHSESLLIVVISSTHWKGCFLFETLRLKHTSIWGIASVRISTVHGRKSWKRFCVLAAAWIRRIRWRSCKLNSEIKTDKGSAQIGPHRSWWNLPNKGFRWRWLL